MFQRDLVEKIETRFVIYNLFFFENRTDYEIMWKNIAEPDRPQMTIWCMYIVRWITKANNTHSECVILNCFATAKWLHERASTLRYMYIACLVLIRVSFLLLYVYYTNSRFIQKYSRLTHCCFVQVCSVLSHADLVCRKEIKPVQSNSAKNLI